MKILMVCLGNICRSPIAEGVMQHLADKRGLDWQVDSAGTGGWHAGEGPDRRAVRTARNYGIDISGQACRKLKKSDFEDFDLIFVMDKSNLHDVIAMAPDNAAIKKVKLLLGDKEVPDPYSDDTLFEPVFRMVQDGCEAIMRQLTK
jgi:protein-tyrosine phosphatase